MAEEHAEQHNAPPGSDPGPTAGAEQFPPEEPYREITVAAVVTGIIIGIIMTASFVFIGLKLGFSLSGSTVAAILGYGVLRGGLGKGSIVENNINQTIASGVNNASAGVVFTLPALFLLAAENPDLIQVKPLPAILAAIGGSFLGVAVIIPLRKQMIEFERLKFPSGIAVATLLKSPGAGVRQAALLVAGALLATAIHSLCNFGLIPEEVDFGAMLGLPAYFPLAIYVSFASLGAGLLSGKGGLPFALGGVLAWWIIAPIAIMQGWVPTPEALGFADSPAGYDGWANGMAFVHMLRPLGIGVLIGGALAGVVASMPALKSALQSLARASKAGGSSEEMSSTVLYAGIVGSVAILFLAARISSPDITTLQCIGISLVGTIWLALAGLIVAQASGMTDISPLSGMSLIAVTLMFFLSGGNAVSSIILGVAVCVGIGMCADMMGDLKSGHLVGAIPRKQQMVQFAVGWIGVPVAVGVLFLLWNTQGFGPGNPELSAPQGAALAGVIESLSAGAAPLDKYAGGIAIGLGLGVFPIAALGVLVGLAMYLPFSITLTYGIGCVISIGLEKTKGVAWIGSTLVPIAAGFIIGEALTNLIATLITLIA